MSISPDIPDWSRELPTRFWDPGRRLLRAIRRYQDWSAKRGLIAFMMKRRWKVSHTFWSVVTGAEIPVTSQLGGGLLIPHPNGIVIHPYAVIGPNCLIMQQVTIGTRGGKHTGHPVLEGHVDVGAGAKILGPVRISKHACIGANAVVITNVAERVSVVGVPAKPVHRINERIETH
jgi:serine O-acetyltransferase